MRSFQQTSGRLVTVYQQSVRFKALSKSSLVQSLVNRITSRSANTLTGIKLVRVIINFTFNHIRSTNCCFVSKHSSHHLGQANTFNFSIIFKSTDECLFENKLPTQECVHRKSLSTTRYVETRNLSSITCSIDSRTTLLVPVNFLGNKEQLFAE